MADRPTDDFSPSQPVQYAESQISASGNTATQTERARGAYLKIFGPDIGVVEYELPEGTITIGRSDNAEIILSHNTVSREHAVITNDGGRYIIEDKGSNYGVAVNGERIDRYFLEEGDSVQISIYVIEFHDCAQKSDAIAAAAEAKMLLRSDYCVLPSTMKLRYRIFKCNAGDIFKTGDTLPVGKGGLLIGADQPPPDGTCMEINLTWPNRKHKQFIGEILGTIPMDSRSWMCVKLHVLPEDAHDEIVAGGDPDEWIDAKMS